MKKSIQLFVLLSAMVFWQACGSKTKENATETSAPTADEIASETAKNDLAAKRERLEKARAEKAEQRRQAALETAKKTPTYRDASGKMIYNKAEVDPSYKGGEEAMMKYLSENLQYPKEARDKGQEGTVYVDFVVGETGKVREVAVADAVGEDVDDTLKDEAGRVVSTMPGWVAARQNGKAVDAKFSIPITFKLSN